MLPKCVVEGGGCPSIYTRRRGSGVAIPGMKPMNHRLLHGGMQPPHEGEDERLQVGAADPRGRLALTSSHRHGLHMVGR